MSNYLLDLIPQGETFHVINISWFSMKARFILERKGMCAIFQKKGKYLKIWAKMYKFENILKKGQPHACDYRMHETARICSGKYITSFVATTFIKALYILFCIFQIKISNYPDH